MQGEEVKFSVSILNKQLQHGLGATAVVLAGEVQEVALSEAPFQLQQAWTP